MTVPDGQRTELSTRELLLDAAERLFADRGLHGVSLREIGLTAGQRNNGATQYHFGSKEGLVLAVFERRSARVNRRRLQLLDFALEEGRGEVRDLIEVFIWPLADEVAEGNFYVTFLDRLRTDGNSQILASASDPAVTSAYRRIGRLLRDGPLRHQSDAVFGNRWASVIDTGINRLARFQSPGVAEAPYRSALSLDAFVTDLIDGLAGFLAAPSRLESDH